MREQVTYLTAPKNAPTATPFGAFKGRTIGATRVSGLGVGIKPDFWPEVVPQDVGQ